MVLGPIKDVRQMKNDCLCLHINFYVAVYDDRL